MSKASRSAPRTINVVRRLSAPTTLAYELGAVAFATAAAPVILLGLRAMGR